MVSPAQLRVLRQLATTNAVRCRRPHGQPWVWLIDGKAESGGVDRLLRRRLAETVDHDTVRITERGRQVLREAAYLFQNPFVVDCDAGTGQHAPRGSRAEAGNRAGSSFNEHRRRG